MVRSFFFIFCLLVLFGTQVQAAINYTVTPIRYELELEPGESITLPASIRNNGTDTVTLPTTKSDFQANGPNGVPSIVRKSELVYPDQELSTWITLSDSSITLAPGEEGSIDFTINVPITATPGGHYGAVLFRNPGSESSAGGTVGINVDYGIIILVDIEGEIVVDVDIDPPVISGGSGSGGGGGNTGGGGGGSRWNGNSGIYTSEPENDDAWYVGEDEEGNPLYENADNCVIDFTPSQFDGRCFDSILDDPLLFGDDNTDEGLINYTDTGGEVGTTNDPQLFYQDFGVQFDFPISNNGNSHVKPEGKVTITDESGKVIPAIGKKTISNDVGTILGEEIVDFIPINDQGGNVLPKTKRIFESEWNGFPYKEYNEQGDQIVKYKSPSEYYTQKNKEEAGFLMFWERVCEVRQHKTLTANIEMTYLDENGDEIVFSAAEDFSVQYVEEQVQINPYIILGMLLVFFALLLLFYVIRYILFAAKNNKCWNCRKSIKSHWDTCPYCEKLQDKKKQKKLDEKYEKVGKGKKKKK